MTKGWFILAIATYALITPWCACGVADVGMNQHVHAGCGAHDHDHEEPQDCDHDHDRSPILNPGFEPTPAPTWEEVEPHPAIPGFNDAAPDEIRWSRSVEFDEPPQLLTRPEVLCVYLA